MTLQQQPFHKDTAVTENIEDFIYFNYRFHICRPCNNTAQAASLYNCESTIITNTGLEQVCHNGLYLLFMSHYPR